MQAWSGRAGVAPMAPRLAAVALLVLGLAMLAGAARAGSAVPGSGPPRALIPPIMLIGDWLTVIRTDGRPQPVRLSIHRIEPGKTAGKLIYASPKRCFVDLEYAGPDGDRHVFYIVPFTNCFRYESSDYVEIMSAQALPGAFNDLSQASPSYRLMPKDQKAASGASDVRPQRGDLPAGRPMVDRMQYTIRLGDRIAETGLLARQ